MKINKFFFLCFLFLSCSSIKNVEENDGTINVGNSNIIITSPNKSQNYSRQDIEIRITDLKKEIIELTENIHEIEKTRKVENLSKRKEINLKKMKEKKNKKEMLLKEWEKLLD